jgi:hypothetical protein
MQQRRLPEHLAAERSSGCWRPGCGVREITPALKCSRRTVREIRDRQRGSPDQSKAAVDPPWMSQIDWPQIIHDLGLGHPLKFLWEDNTSITPRMQLNDHRFEFYRQRNRG